MKLLSTDMPIPPMPEPLAAPPVLEEQTTREPDMARRGRPAAPQPDPRIPEFSQWLRETNHALMTVGSYTAAVSAVLRRGVPPDAPEDALASLEMSPSSLALYVRAWRNWLRFTGVIATMDVAVSLRKAASALCNCAKGRHKPSLAALRQTPWSSLQLLSIDGTQHFTLSNGESTWLWLATPTTLPTLNALIESANGGVMPDDDAAYARALDAISHLKVYA